MILLVCGTGLVFSVSGSDKVCMYVYLDISCTALGMSVLKGMYIPSESINMQVLPARVGRTALCICVCVSVYLALYSSGLSCLCQCECEHAMVSVLLCAYDLNGQCVCVSVRLSCPCAKSMYPCHTHKLTRHTGITLVHVLLTYQCLCAWQHVCLAPRSALSLSVHQLSLGSLAQTHV